MGARLVIVGAVVFGAVLACGATAVPAAQNKSPRPDFNSGEHLYKEFCAACHGERGDGDGPAANTLARRATDLTLLTRRNGGTFPRGDVLSAIEGSKAIPAHAGPSMPNWRDIFDRLEGGDEREIRRRLDALVAHVETLQVKE